MQNPFIHYGIIAIIGLSLLFKIVMVLAFGNLEMDKYWYVELISIGAYSLYMGWVGFERERGSRFSKTHGVLATVLIILDLIASFYWWGWKR